MLNTSFELVGVGSPIIDVLARIPESFLERIGGEKGGMVLTDGETIGKWMAQLPAPFEEAPGGSSGNTIFAAARMGIRTTFVGKTGNDAGGTFYRERLKALGGDDTRFKIGTIPNGRCLSLITPDSQRTLRTDLGAAATLTPEEITPADFIGCSHAHVEGYLLFNPDLMKAVLKSAKEANCTISLDLASFEVVKAAGSSLPELLKEYVDLVFANEDEAAAFHGGPDTLENYAVELAGLCELAVVKAGADGAWIAKGTETIHAPAVPGVKAIDTTGAGDFWAAGFLAGWLHGKPLEVCAAWGARLGAEIVQVIGAELPDEKWEQVMKDIS
ncbi:adenosine kinase [Puniceicoccales bacterium CK1056]|uniref:Adenosine kinase n=1 Tax=Oceanipulchritudo coccoides TaxID=2706888 RepID=A0A6B2LYK5_9BACT|nr:adenosine kinase [Oceanipulchritudo coccoides]NDV61688.1 adenosine kinase [Oceanipulchritudo coccoides]